LVLEEAPAAGALELTGRGALEQAGRLDARGLDLELDGVGDRAAPDVAAALADAALVAGGEALGDLDPGPPLGPALRLVDRIPHALALDRQQPGRQEAVVGHGGRPRC